MPRTGTDNMVPAQQESEGQFLNCDMWVVSIGKRKERRKRRQGSNKKKGSDTCELIENVTDKNGQIG